MDGRWPALRWPHLDIANYITVPSDRAVETVAIRAIAGGKMSSAIAAEECHIYGQFSGNIFSLESRLQKLATVLLFTKTSNEP
ncbi:hypothetical protein H6F61_19930 [Cyanobacteria bacterium FACHB-472]|nr:hypothetical protein [Cyanobacteria bacterium FACHB-472]